MSNKALREAFEAGTQYARETHPNFVRPCKHCRAEALRRYPKRMETRAREVAVAGLTYRVVDGVVQVRYGSTWMKSGFNLPKELVSLIANPTEIVEVDD